MVEQEQQVEPLLFDETTAAKMLHYENPKSVKRLAKAGEIAFFKRGAKRLYDDKCINDYLARIRVASKVEERQPAGVVSITSKKRVKS